MSIFDTIFSSVAHAQEAAPAAAPAGGIANFLPLILILIIFYFFLIRPQHRRLKEHKQMVEALRRGDKVVTAGGIVGTISKVSDNGMVTVEISKGTEVEVVKSTITEVLTRKDSPANTNVPEKADKKAKK